MVRPSRESTDREGLKEWSLNCPIVYGPVNSRRHGFSLGINLLPEDRKICNFDCLYCQCGRSSRQTVLDSFSKVSFSPLLEIEKKIASRFSELELANAFPDTIVFSGNGEPTLHPGFAEVCEVVRTYRDRHLPQSKIGILTNGTNTIDPSIFQALIKLDWTSIKLDAGVLWLDRPLFDYDLAKLIPVWRQVPALTIQSFFNEGPLANIRSEVVEPWIEQIKRIHPGQVHIYTIDRRPAVKAIQKASLASLTRVARQLVARTGVKVEVYE